MFPVEDPSTLFGYYIQVNGNPRFIKMNQCQIKIGFLVLRNGERTYSKLV